MKLYKLFFRTQSQTHKNGRIYEHKLIRTSLPAEYVEKIGATVDDPSVVIDFDEKNNQIIIKKG